MRLAAICQLVTALGEEAENADHVV
jgi:hypothetical protein